MLLVGVLFLLELMIPPHYQLGGTVVAPPSRLGWSQVQTLVWQYFLFLHFLVMIAFGVSVQVS
jgi:hypothetical protein